MGDCDLQLATSNIQNGGNRQWTSYCDQIKSKPYGWSILNVDHICIIDIMQVVNLQTFIVAINIAHQINGLILEQHT